jgi:hypothetical protein
MLSVDPTQTLRVPPIIGVTVPDYRRPILFPCACVPAPATTSGKRVSDLRDDRAASLRGNRSATMSRPTVTALRVHTISPRSFSRFKQRDTVPWLLMPSVAA